MVLNIVPAPLRDAYAAGNWKDIASLNLLFDELELEHRTAYIEYGKEDEILSLCTSEDVSDVVIQYSFWSYLLKKIRKCAPHVRLHVRTHNAEPFQHWQRSEVTLMPNYRNLRAVYGAARLLGMDSLCRLRADTLLGISVWDNRNYWGLLPGSATIMHAPYYSPWPYLRPQIVPLPYMEREAAIVCMAGGRDPIGKTMVNGFNRLAEAFNKTIEGKGWRFLLSRGVHHNVQKDNVSPNVTVLENLDEPWDLLCNVRAVALLTPLGFGTKTTIIDGLAAGCHVIVHPVIARRLPDEVSKLCISYDPSQKNNIDNLKERLKSQPPANNVNIVLRAQALNSLRRVLAPRNNSCNVKGNSCKESPGINRAKE